MKTIRSNTGNLLRVAIAATLGSCAAPLAYAQDQAATTPPEDEVGEVVVTGTRVATRTRLDSLAPIDVLPAAMLEKQGSTELAEALSTVAPSLDFPRPSITDGTDHIRPATLRGLAPDQTLVLVNSKRRHQSALVNINGSVGRGSAAVDLNAIPLAAIESVEVLRDGASAQYGSDAIAGVINLRLRDAREGGDAGFTYGEYDTDVETERGQRHASDGATMTASGWVGLPLGEEGFLTLSGEYRDREPTSRGDFDSRVPGSPVTSRYGDSDVRDITGYVNAGIPLEGDWNIYGWAGYQNREGNSAAFPRIFNDARNVPAIYPNGFLPLITTDIDDVAVGWGVRGKVGEWDADISLVYGLNDVHYGVEDSLNTSFGAASQTSFDAGSMEYDQLVFNAGVVRGFEVGNLPEPLNLALGVEARRENYSIEAGEPASYELGPVAGAPAGAQGFPGFRPSNEVDEDRTAYSAYVDLEARLTKQFLASVAVRGEHYSDFGSAVTGKLAARFDFTDSFALRGNVSTGFRAPGLQQEFFTSTATNFINGIPVEVGTFPGDLGCGDHAGRTAARCRRIRQLFIGHSAAFQRLRSHHRRVPHRHRRPHRALGESQHRTGGGAHCAHRGRPLLHQWRRNQNRGHRRGREIRAGHGKPRTVRLRGRGQLERHRGGEGAHHQRHFEHLQRAAAKLHTAGAVRSRQYPGLRRGHPRQQDQPGHRLGTARGWRRLGREPQGHPLRQCSRARRAIAQPRSTPAFRTRATCTSSRTG